MPRRAPRRLLRPRPLRPLLPLLLLLASGLPKAEAVALRLDVPLQAQSRAAAARPASFCNPLDLGYRFQLDQPSRREAADPTVVVFKRRYFLFASKSGGYWHSPDLASWSFVEPRGLPLEDYAPTAVVLDGRVYFTASNSEAIFASEDPVGGNWTRVASIGKYWDPSLFVDDDGKVYLTWGCSNSAPIRVVQIDPSRGWQTVGQPVVAAFGDPGRHGWERFTDWRAAVLGPSPFVEGSWLNKVNGRYYLQYAAPGTELKSYGDGVFVSDTSPLGPYRRDPQSPASHKPTGFVGGAGHGSTFQDLQGRWWHVGTGTVNVRHNMERRVMLFPAHWEAGSLPAHLQPGPGGAAAAQSLVVDTTFGDFPRRLDQSRPPWQLLSLFKQASASSTLARSPALHFEGQAHVNWWNSPPQLQERSYAAAGALDEDVRTWWSAASGAAGEWLAVDLGATSVVHAVQVNFADEGATALGRLQGAYRYYVEVSEDGTAWELLEDLDRRDNARDAPHDYVELAQPVRLRHLRLTNAALAPGGARFSISGLRLFGQGPGEPPGQVPQVAATRDARNPERATVTWDSAERAQYYVVRYGLVGGPAFHSHQVFGGATSLQLDELSRGESYRFVVDAVNEAGWAPGEAEAHA